MPNSAAVCLARLDHEDRLERRAQQLFAWSQRVGISRLEGPGAQALDRFAPLLPALAKSRLLGASEFKAASIVSRSTCRELGEPELLAPVLRVVLAGFAEARGLASAAAERLYKTEDTVGSARVRLKEITRPQLLAVKQELHAAVPHHQFKPAQCYIAFEGVSLLIQPDEKAQDEFAVQKLFTSGHLVERAVTFVPEQMTLVHRQKLWQFLKKNRVDLERIRSRGDAASVFVEWINAVANVTEELPKIIGLHRAKEAVQSHIVPLAQWALRPQLNISLGRCIPPPLIDPDMVGRLRGLTATKVPFDTCARSSGSPVKSPYAVGVRPVQKPILGEAEACFIPAPPAVAAPQRRPQRPPSQMPASSAGAPAPLQQWVNRHVVSTGSPLTASSAVKPKMGDRMSRRPSTCSTASTENRGEDVAIPSSSCSTASTENFGEENSAVGGPWSAEELFLHQREKEDAPIDFCLSSDEEDEYSGSQHECQSPDQSLLCRKAQDERLPNKKVEDEWLSTPRMAMAG